ncbi:ribonuclease H-like domain-containing protein [Tanacetum coccineum]
MCDKKNSVLFTDTECVVLSLDFKLLDENYVLLRVPRKDNMYSVDLKNIVPLGSLNFKTMNKLVRGNLVRGIENLIDLKVKVIRCDNGTEFKNKVMNQLCEMKGIKREFSVARTPQQNGVKATNGDSTIRKDYILLPMWPADPLFSQNSKESPDAGFKTLGEEEKKDAKDPVNESGNPTKGKDSEVPSTEEPRINQEKDDYINSTNNINTASDGNNTNNVNVVSSTVNDAGTEVNVVDLKTSIKLSKDPIMLELEDIFISDEG